MKVYWLGGIKHDELYVLGLSGKAMARSDNKVVSFLNGSRVLYYANWERSNKKGSIFKLFERAIYTELEWCI